VAERHASVGRVARSVFRRAGWVTACSEDLRTRALALGASASRSSVVPYGVDTARFARTPALRATGRRRLGVGQDEVVILAIGRLVRKKGFEYLVDAVAGLAAAGRLVTLVLAGGGDLDAELRERARAVGIAALVRFPGNVPHDQVAAALAAADVVVVPSIRDDAGNVDGLPNVVLEALASGTPLVATGAGGIGAVVRDQRTGLLVAERDPAALASAIASLLDDPARAAAIGEAARHEAAVAFGWDRAAERFEQAYNQAAVNRG
jgi:glycosyltransferase involved in cell wall biosynthesis